TTPAVSTRTTSGVSETYDASRVRSTARPSRTPVTNNRCCAPRPRSAKLWGVTVNSADWSAGGAAHAGTPSVPATSPAENTRVRTHRARVRCMATFKFRWDSVRWGNAMACVDVLYLNRIVSRIPRAHWSFWAWQDESK